MQIKDLAKRLGKRLLSERILEKIKDEIGAPSMTRSLRLLKIKGFQSQAAIDIGAYQGSWSRDFSKIYPQARILMVEALEEQRCILNALAKELPNVRPTFSLLSDENGNRIQFYANNCGSSIYKPKRFNAEPVDMASLRLDDLIKREGFPAPDTIKIDVQGAELKVLNGGQQAVKNVEILIIELSLVNSYSAGALAHEMIAYLAERDLFLYDITGLLRVNRTRSVNEVDAIFVRRSSPLWDINHFLPLDAPKA